MTISSHEQSFSGYLGLATGRYRLMATTAMATALLASAAPALAQQTVVDNTEQSYHNQSLDGLRIINDGSVYGANLTIGQNEDNSAGVSVTQGHAELVGGSITQGGTGKYVSGITAGSNEGAGTVDVSDMTITVEGGKDAGGLFVNGQNARIEADGVSIELTATGSSTAEPAAALKARAGTIEIANSAVEVTGDTVFGILTAAYAPAASVVSIENDITTWGDRGYGAFAYSNPDSPTQSNDSLIAIHGGSLTTSGDQAHGLVAQGSLSLISTSEGLEVTTGGERAHGAYALRGSTITAEDVDITTTGSRGYGLYSTGAGSVINASDVAISTTEDWTFGAYATDEGTITLDGGSIATEGERAFGILASTGGTITSSADVTTTGARAHGVQSGENATGDSGTVNLIGGTISTGGDDAFGLHALASGTISATGDVLVSTTGVNGFGAFAESDSSISLDGTTIRTTGANGFGLLVNNDNATTGGQIAASNVDVLATGAGAQAARIESGGEMTISNSRLEAQNAAGIVLRENATVVLDGTTLTSAEESFRSILTEAGQEQTIIVGAGSEIITNNGTLLLVDRSGDGADGQVEFVLEAGSTSLGDILDEGERSETGGTDVTVEEGASWRGVLRGIRNFFGEGEVEAEFEDDADFAGDFTTDAGSRYTFDRNATFQGNVESEGSDFTFSDDGDATIAGNLNATGSTFAFGHDGTTRIVGNVDVTDTDLSFGQGSGETTIEGNVSLGGNSRTTGGTIANPIQAGGDVTVGGNSVMGGNWSVGTDLTVNEGTLTPGNSIGVVTVAGDVTFGPGSTYEVEIAGGGNTPGIHNDFLDVGGEATLNGGTVVVGALDDETSYVNGTVYTILTAADGVSGTFAEQVDHPSIFIDTTLDYDEENVFLTIALTDDFPRYAQTSNQVQAATALNDLEQSGDALAVYNAILSASTDEEETRRIFDLTSGQAHASAQNVVNQTFSQFSRTLHQQGAAGIQELTTDNVILPSLPYGPVMTVAADAIVAIDDIAPVYTDQPVQRAWISPMGGGGSVDGDGNAAGGDWWSGGLAGGYEGELDVAVGQAFAGLGMGYIRSRTTVEDLASTVDADTFQLGAYGGWADGPWTVSGSLGYAASHLDTSRNIVFGTIDRTAGADYWTHSLGFSGEAAYGMALNETTTLSPLATLDLGWSGHGGFSETGADALNLTGTSESWTRFDTGLGVALQHVLPTDNGQVALQGRVVWEHAFSDVAANQSLSLEGSPTGFAVSSPDASRDRLRLGGGIAWNASDEMTLRADYEGLFSSDEQSHGASFGLNVSF